MMASNILSVSFSLEKRRDIVYCYYLNGSEIVEFIYISLFVHWIIEGG